MYGFIKLLEDELNNVNSLFPNFQGSKIDKNSIEQQINKQLSMIIPIDIFENSEKFVLTANLPGVSKENIILDYKNSFLTISVSENHTKSQTEDKLIYSEISSSIKSRTIEFKDIDSQNIKAKFENGVLNLELPKFIKQSNSSKINID